MQQITQPIAQVIWYSTALSLAAAPWRLSTAIVRMVNPQGTGYISFTPGSNFNALTSVAAGQVLIVESTTSAYTAGYGLENGTAPTATANAVRLVAHFAANQTNLAFPLKITSPEQAGSYIVDSGNQPVGVSISAYAINGGTVGLPTPALVVGDTLTITGSTGLSDGYLTLIKQ